MTPADVDQIVTALLRDEWGDRRSNLDFATSHPQTYPVVADADGTIVGTGLVTVNGATAWIGTVWVDPAWRRQGLGSALTRRRSTPARRPARPPSCCRDRMGADPLRGPRVRGPDLVSDARGARTRCREAGRSTHPSVRARGPGGDHGTRSCGDGRGPRTPPRAFAHPDTARVLVRADGSLGGFVVRAPWGGGATIAPESMRRRPCSTPGGSVGAGQVVRAGLLDENEAGRERLLRAGWTTSWRAPRLVRGDAPAWQPTAIWGQFNLAHG